MSKISKETIILVSCFIIMTICMHISLGIGNDVLGASIPQIKPVCEFATDFVIVFSIPSKLKKK